jgi:hypothetical protein
VSGAPCSSKSEEPIHPPSAESLQLKPHGKQQEQTLLPSQAFEVPDSLHALNPGPEPESAQPVSKEAILKCFVIRERDALDEMIDEANATKHLVRFLYKLSFTI